MFWLGPWHVMSVLLTSISNLGRTFIHIYLQDKNQISIRKCFNSKQLNDKKRSSPEIWVLYFYYIALPLKLKHFLRIFVFVESSPPYWPTRDCDINNTILHKNKISNSSFAWLSIYSLQHHFRVGRSTWTQNGTKLSEEFTEVTFKYFQHFN